MNELISRSQQYSNTIFGLFRFIVRHRCSVCVILSILDASLHLKV